MKRIILTDVDFTKLTSGEVVTKEGTQLILEDIGFVRMVDILRENINISLKNGRS